MVLPGASDIWSCGSSSLPPFLLLKCKTWIFFSLLPNSHPHTPPVILNSTKANQCTSHSMIKGRSPSSISFLHSSQGQLESDDFYKFQLALSPENWEKSHSQPAKNQKARAHTLELTSVPLQLKQFLSTSQSTCCRNWPPRKTNTIFTQKEYNIITQHLKNTRTWSLPNRMR